MDSTEKPLVSIFMFCKDRVGSISRAVESVLNQSYDNIELVIQDGASTDGTLEILKSYGDRISLISEPDSGPAEAMVRAMRRCSGEIVGSCLSDEELLPDAVKTAVERFGEMPWADVLTGDAYVTDAEGEITGEFIGSAFNLLDYLTASYTPYFVSSFFRMKALTDVGLHSHQWHEYGVEFELWTRLGIEKTILYLPGKVAKYALHPDQLSHAKEQVFKHYRARAELIDWLFLRDEVFWDPNENVDMPKWLSMALKYNAIYRTGSVFINHLIATKDYPSAQALLDRVDADAREWSLEVANPELRQLAHRYARLLLSSDITDWTRNLPAYLQKAAAGRVQEPPIEIGPDGRQRLVLPAMDEWFYGYVANILCDRGLIHPAVTLWNRQGLSEKNRLPFMSMAVQAALKHPAFDNEACQKLHRLWVERCLEAEHPEIQRPRHTNKRIRIGYIGAHWGAEYMRYQCANFAALHDRERFETFCYAGTGVQPYMFEAFDHVKEVGPISEEAFVELLRIDQIDIAVEITGFSPGHRFLALAKRCAPVQVQYLNHNGTCGVPNVDYVIADEHCVTPDFDRHYSEKIYRLPGCFTCFSYDSADLPPISPPPHQSKGFVTFGCFGSGSKINEPLLALWAKILAETPDSVLYLRNHQLNRTANRRYVEQIMAGYGIGSNRLRIEPGGTRQEILEAYAEVDISLDTWPYCGGNTIAESIWQGVPVASLHGETFAAAYGSSLLVGSGLTDLVAESPNDYVAKACRLARDPGQLQRYRNQLRSMVVKHGFGDPHSLVTRIEAAYIEMLDAAFGG